MELILDYLTVFAEGYLLLWFYDIFIGRKCGNRILFSFVYSAILTLLGYITDYHIISSFIPFIFIICYGISYKHTPFKQVVSISIISLLNTVIINALYVLISTYFFSNPDMFVNHELPFYTYFVSFTCKFTIYIECLYLSKYLDKSFFVDKKFVAICISYSLITMYLCVFLINKYIMGDIDMNFVSRLFIFVVGSHLFIHYSIIVLTKTIRENEKQKLVIDTIEHDKVFYTMMDEKINEIRALKHDYSNNLMIIYDMVRDNDIYHAKEYLKKLEIDEVPSTIKTENRIINHILNNKINYAKKQGIKVRYKINGTNYNYIDIVDLSTILSNLIDNAIEATMRVENKTIDINLEFIYEDVSNIIISNSSLPLAYNKLGQIISSKGNGKRIGVGLQSIKERVDRYNGEDILKYEDGVCTHLCILYNNL